MVITPTTWTSSGRRGGPTNSPVMDKAMEDIRYEHGEEVTCCLERGDVDHSGGMDVADLTWLVARLFLGGPPPPCETEGDADGSGGIDVADLNYLVARLFHGGPLPPPCN